MILTYKYRIKDRSASKVLRRYSWASNQVWNWCVAQQRDTEDRYRAGALKRKWLTHFDLTKCCKGVGKDLGINQQTVGAVCRQFAANRDKTRHAPRFRASSGSRRALGWIPFEKGSRQVDGNSIIYLSRRFRFWEGGRPLPDNAKGGCFVEDARGRWYACFYAELVQHQSTGIANVGIDLGLKSLAACSDGTLIEPLHAFRKYERKLATAQRAGNKQRAKTLHAKIKNSRKDFLHKASTKIARENALIAVGNVSSSKLAKTRMAKSVYDAGWSMFRSQLEYKASRHRAVYLNIDEKFTTQRCSCCGVIPDSSPKGICALGIRAWVCSECGASHDRDVNAAKNILALALSAQRPVEESLLEKFNRISTNGKV